MSAVMLSLSVMSLLLPVLYILAVVGTDRLTKEQTAFHASFNRTDEADNKTLKVSRGTSVVSTALHLVISRLTYMTLGSAARLRSLSDLPAQVSCVLIHKYATGTSR